MLYYCIFTGISILLTFPPAVWHYKQQNTASIILIFWIVISNIFNLINVLIWDGKDISKAWNGVGWCDISVRIMWASFVGMSGSSAAIARYLTLVLQGSPLLSTHRGRVVNMMVDCSFGLLVPAIQMALLYIVQAYRYFLYQDYGCIATASSNWVFIFSIAVWPPVFSLIGAYYGLKVLFITCTRKNVFLATLKNSKTQLSAHRFLRLLLIAIVFIFVLFTLNLLVFMTNVSYEINSFSWSEIHQWTKLRIEDQIVRFSAEEIQAPLIHQLTLYSTSFCGYLFFLLFGTGADAMNMYKSWIEKISRKFGLSSKDCPDFLEKRHVLIVDIENDPIYSIAEVGSESYISGKGSSYYSASWYSDKDEKDITQA